MRRVSPLWVLVCAGVWWSLASPRADAWIVAGLAVLAGVLLHVGLGGRGAVRPRLGGLVAFLPFFVREMVEGGVDVSRRALSPSLPLDPDFIRYTVRLPDGLPRVFFINAISLLPGTFSARVRSEEITVHRLSGELASEALLRRLEGKVAALFGVDLEEGSGP